MFVLICSCFYCPPLQGLAHQHHRNKSALQKELESSIYARILATLPFTGCSGQGHSLCLRNYPLISMKGTNDPTRLLFFKVPAPGKRQMTEMEISCDFSHTPPGAAGGAEL